MEMRTSVGYRANDLSVVSRLFRVAYPTANVQALGTLLQNICEGTPCVRSLAEEIAQKCNPPIVYTLSETGHHRFTRENENNWQRFCIKRPYKGAWDVSIATAISDIVPRQEFANLIVEKYGADAMLLIHHQEEAKAGAYSESLAALTVS